MGSFPPQTQRRARKGFKKGKRGWGRHTFRCLPLAQSGPSLRFRFMFFVRRFPDLSCCVQVHDRDTETYEDVGPDGLPQVSGYQASHDDGDARYPVVPG